MFTAVCELPADERAGVLDRECADDPWLRQKVEALLAKDADAGSFMEQPALGEKFELEAGGLGLDETAAGIAEPPVAHVVSKSCTVISPRRSRHP